MMLWRPTPTRFVLPRESDGLTEHAPYCGLVRKHEREPALDEQHRCHDVAHAGMFVALQQTVLDRIRI